MYHMRRMSTQETKQELVNHPAHYKAGGIEVLDIIHAFRLGFSGGNVVKYLLRAGRKSLETKGQDLQKAMFYLNDMIVNESGFSFSDEQKEKMEKLLAVYNEIVKSAPMI